MNGTMDTQPLWTDSAPRWPRLRQTLLDSGYALSALPIALPAFVLMVFLLASGVGLLITLLGLPILTLAIEVSRGFARFERFRIREMLGKPAPMPAYLCSRWSDGRVRRILLPLRDPQSWLDVAWCVLGFVTGLVAFVVTLVWWAAVLNGLTYWFWSRFLPQDGNDESLAHLIGLGDSRAADVFLQSAIGVVALLTLPFVVRLVALTHSGLARMLLSSRAELQHEVTRIQGSRDAAREAEAGALRRLERDIHDGPQQRLVRLSMDLGRARKQLEKDPEQARETLDAALMQARATVDELRSLSRGIAPPVLVDRGLRAALEELAARSPIPVEVYADLPADLPPHVETAAYFVVSEALTNVAKHSGARSVSVAVSEADGSLMVEVADDGIGGAHPGKGQGLAGLEQRVRGVDGTLVVSSPEGGPTIVRAEIPCAS